MQIVPISAGFGATVCDVGLEELGGDEFRHLEDAFHAKQTADAPDSAREAQEVA